MSARDEILARIAASLGPSPHLPEVPREYRRAAASPPGAPDLLDLFVDRLEDYRATVHRCAADDATATVARALADHGATRIVVPAALDGHLLGEWPGTWTPDSADAPLDVATLDGLDGVLTGCALAVADTGTIVLDGSAECGRRAITLVPDLHVVVVRADQVVGSVPEGVGQLDPRRPLTLISGPSATSDIELDRVEGVHGPHTLVVVLVAARPSGPPDSRDDEGLANLID